MIHYLIYAKAIYNYKLYLILDFNRNYFFLLFMKEKYMNKIC